MWRSLARPRHPLVGQMVHLAEGCWPPGCLGGPHPSLLRTPISARNHPLHVRISLSYEYVQGKRNGVFISVQLLCLVHRIF